MLFAISGLKGYAVAASDGRIGTVKDFLFDDRTWGLRWMVVDTGTWLPGRKVLIHPSAIAPLDAGSPSADRLPQMSAGPDPVLSVRLTRAQIEAGPDVGEHEPVSRQMEHRLHEHFGWQPYWVKYYYGGNVVAMALSPYLAEPAPPEPAEPETQPGTGEPHLRSVAEVVGYHIHATDGGIGHVENFLADDANWDVRYLIAATRNWWPGRHVLLAPYAVRDIDWQARHISLNVTRDQVKSSPPWDPAAAVDRITEQQLHSHYGWPGYGW